MNATATDTTAATISRDELVAAIQRGDVQVVNVLERPPQGRLRLIAGSISIPLSELAHAHEQLDRSKGVVVYCASPECDMSRMAAAWLAQMGYRARAYEGGITEWHAAGLPTV